ncbi:MAG: hypothetical protein U0414_00050 [Polyangiaceae bacterium]
MMRRASFLGVAVACAACAAPATPDVEIPTASAPVASATTAPVATTTTPRAPVSVTTPPQEPGVAAEECDRLDACCRSLPRGSLKFSDCLDLATIARDMNDAKGCVTGRNTFCGP